MSDQYHYRKLIETLIECGERVRAAVVAAEFHRIADVVGMGADGAATTHIDKLAEDAALEFLERAEPRMNIVSEEAGFFDRGSSLTAIVDPVDATNNATAVPNFLPQPNGDLANLASAPLRAGHVFGFPFYAFSIGVVEDGELVAGCVRNLPTGEVFTAARGLGVELDGIPVAGSGRRELAGARVSFVRPETGTSWHVIEPIMVGPGTRVRITGCSALDLALISCGSHDAMINPNLVSPGGHGEKIVDYAGGLALLNEMGGVLTGFDGSSIAVDYDLTRRTPLLAATTPELHEELVKLLHRVEWDEANP